MKLISKDENGSMALHASGLIVILSFILLLILGTMIGCPHYSAYKKTVNAKADIKIEQMKK